MGLSPQGASFLFTSDKGNLSANVTSLSVETPEARVVDMTTSSSGAEVQTLVPTGEYTGGSVQVEYIRFAGQTDPNNLLGGVGSATFSSSGLTVTKQVYLRRASEDARVGDVVRGRLEFGWTDYSP